MGGRRKGRPAADRVRLARGVAQRFAWETAVQIALMM
jgi:hypothetical protein